MNRWLWMTLFSLAATPCLANAATPAVATSISQDFSKVWNEKGITPAPEVDDAHFLRRVYLDIAGTLPTAEQVRTFLAEKSSDKRGKVVEDLLHSPEYSIRWANYWDAVLMGRVNESAVVDKAGFKAWLREQFAANTPWDKIVFELIAAEGWNTNRTPANANGDPPNFKEHYRPATNFYLKYWQALPELSGATAKTFLGLQIQCAQCHDHKTEKWTKKDFQQYTAYFAKTYPSYFDKSLILGIPRLEVKDRLFAPPTSGKLEMYFSSYKEYVGATPKLLEGKEMSGYGKRREELAKWITAKDNPYFAKAIVNRMWSVLLGRGFVEPIDDFRPSNPAEMPDVLEALTADFLAHDYDLRHLIRVICATRPYQLACRTEKGTSKNPADNLWSSYPLKQLDIEVLFEMVLQGTGSEKYLDRISRGKLELVRGAFAQQFVMQMGTDDMAEVSSSEETIPLALMMLNGPLWTGTSRTTSGLGLAELLRSEPEDERRIQSLYLTTLSRLPKSNEMSHWKAYVNENREVVSTPGPNQADLPTGLKALAVSPEIAKAPEDADFAQLVKYAKTGADFGALAKRMKNNADAGQYARALREFTAEVPFRYLAAQGGAKSAKEQAYEDLHWALLNCSEFLTNH